MEDILELAMMIILKIIKLLSHEGLRDVLSVSAREQNIYLEGKAIKLVAQFPNLTLTNYMTLGKSPKHKFCLYLSVGGKEVLQKVTSCDLVINS